MDVRSAYEKNQRLSTSHGTGVPAGGTGLGILTCPPSSANSEHQCPDSQAIRSVGRLLLDSYWTSTALVLEIYLSSAGLPMDAD